MTVLKTSARALTASEIADVLVELRARTQELDMKFLSYLLEMAYIEAFEQSVAVKQNPTCEPRTLLKQLRDQY